MKIGDKIKIIEMEGEPIYAGKVGVIKYIDDVGQLHGTWGGLAVNPKVDTIEILEGGEKEIKIKGCPFCKRKDDIKKEIIQLEDKSYNYIHFCHHLGAKTRLCISLNGETPEDVIEKWNSRGGE